jgi:hypothetical protein
MFSTSSFHLRSLPQQEAYEGEHVPEGEFLIMIPYLLIASPDTRRLAWIGCGRYALLYVFRYVPVHPATIYLP